MPADKSSEISKATISDLPEMGRISMAAKAHWGYPDEWMRKWQPGLKPTAQNLLEWEVWKLVVDGKLVGWCGINPREGYYEVEHLWVNPADIGQGWGRILLTESLRRSVATGSRVVVLSDPYAKPFYEKTGFVHFDDLESYPPGRMLPHMEMVWHNTVAD